MNKNKLKPLLTGALILLGIGLGWLFYVVVSDEPMVIKEEVMQIPAPIPSDPYEIQRAIDNAVDEAAQQAEREAVWACQRSGGAWNPIWGTCDMSGVRERDIEKAVELGKVRSNLACIMAGGRWDIIDEVCKPRGI